MSSTEVEDKTVQAEPVKTPVGRDAFTAARAELQSRDQASKAPAEPPPDDTSKEETPAQEPETVADEPTETTSTEDTILTADELAALSPKERANAEKWQAKLTKKAQELSAKAKDFDQWQPLIGALRDNPDAAIEQLAKQRGLTLNRPAQDTTVQTEVAARFTKAIAALPEELRPLFQPALEALGQEVLASVDGKMRPLAETQHEIVAKAAAAETDGEVKAFAASHADYQKHEPAMLQWMQKFQPMDGVTSQEYMEAAYQAVTAGLKKVEQVKAAVKQINRSAASVEPNTPGVPEGRVEQTMPANWNDMTSKERMRAAYEAAGKGIIWKK